MKGRFRAEYDRLMDSLPNTSLDDYGLKLQCIERIIGLSEYADDHQLEDEPAKDNIVPLKVMSSNELPDKVEEQMDDTPPAEMVTVEEPTPTYVPEEEPPQHPTYTTAQVRGALAKARVEKGIDINDLVQRMGYKNFTEIPPEDYWELLDLAGVTI